MIGNLIAAATPVQRALAVAAGAFVLVLALAARNPRKDIGATALPDASQSATVPAIDADVAIRTEIATFALG